MLAPVSASRQGRAWSNSRARPPAGPLFFYGALQTRVCPLRRNETSSLDVAQRTEAGVGIRNHLRVYLALPCARCHYPYLGEGGR